MSVEALTLRTYPFGESHKVVIFLSRHTGRIRSVAYGAQKSRSRFGSALEVLTYLRLTCRSRENQELAVIENCEIIRPSPAFRLGWEESLHLAYWAELLVEFSREQVASERLFRLSLAVIEAAGKVPAALLSRYFEFWTLRLEGVLPALDSILSRELAVRTAGMLRLRPAELGDCSFSEEDLEQLESAAGRLIENQLEKPLKAKKLLKELL